MINTTTIKLNNIKDFDNNYIEQELSKHFCSIIRWAIVKIDDKFLTVSVSAES